MRTRVLLSLFLAFGMAASAEARTGHFGVSVQVVDRIAATSVLDAIPVPAQARMFHARHGDRGYAYSGSADEAAAFFEAQMPRQGYRVLSRHEDGQAVRQVWANGDDRVQLSLQRTLGANGLTRIRVIVSGAARRPLPSLRDASAQARAD